MESRNFNYVIKRLFFIALSRPQNVAFGPEIKSGWTTLWQMVDYSKQASFELGMLEVPKHGQKSLLLGIELVLFQQASHKSEINSSF